MSTVNATKTQYSSLDLVDKIPVYSTTTDAQGIGINAKQSVGPVIGTPSTDTTTYIATLDNPYGKKCLTTLSWSLDGENYLPSDEPQYYFNSDANEYLLQVLPFMACSDSTIYFMVNTSYTADQTVYLQFALDSL